MQIGRVSVTNVLQMATDFSKIPADVLYHAAARGTTVHACCASHARRLWFKRPDDPIAAGMVESFVRWFDEWIDKTRPIYVERELHCPTFDFIGHPDIIAFFVMEDAPRVIDIKTPLALSRTWRGQLAAYRHLAKVNGIATGPPMALQLDRTGKMARGIVYPENESNMDFSAFLNGLNFFRYFSK